MAGRETSTGRYSLIWLVEAEPVHAGGGEDHGIEVVLGELADAGLDVAADVDHLQVGAQVQQLGLAAQGAVPMRAPGAGRASWRCRGAG